jgi:hypothetical protein
MPRIRMRDGYLFQILHDRTHSVVSGFVNDGDLLRGQNPPDCA